MFFLFSGIKPAKQDQDGFVFTRDPRLKIAMLGSISMDQAMEMASRITCEVLNVRATEGLEHSLPEMSYDQVLEQIGKSAKKLEVHLIEGTHHLHLNNAERVAPCMYNFLTT